MEFSKQDYWSGFISFSNLQYSTRIYIQYAIITYYQKESEKIDIYVCVWRRQWHPTPVLLPGEFQGQRSLVGCRLWGRTESDTAERLSSSSSMYMYNNHCCTPETLYISSDSESVNHSVVSNSLWPMDCSPPGSSVHGILQARILEWVAISFSRGSSQHRDQTWVLCIAGRFFSPSEPPGKPISTLFQLKIKQNKLLSLSAAAYHSKYKCERGKPDKDTFGWLLWLDSLTFSSSFF